MRDKIDFTPNYGTKENSSIIKVIGVGGGGGNAVMHMYSEGIVGVDFLVCNTDRQALDNNRVSSKLVLGDTGLGAGANPEVARELALSSRDRIRSFIGEETKMLFITAGMGKGTGTGAAPVVAEIAKEMGILTIAVVTYPFGFEGMVRADLAQKGIEELRKHVDSLLIIKNQNIMKYYSDASIKTAFGYADDVLKNAVKCIAELITVHAHQNVDFNDIATIMTNSGEAMLGHAVAEGENRISEVVDRALSSPLLNDGDLITNAKNFLFFITYGSEKELLISELDMLTQKFDEIKNRDATVIWGRAEDESLGSAVKLSVIITNFRTQDEQKVKKTNEVPIEINVPINNPTPTVQTKPKNPFDDMFSDSVSPSRQGDSGIFPKGYSWPEPNNSENSFATTQNPRTANFGNSDSSPRNGNPECIKDGNNMGFENPTVFENLYTQPSVLREIQTQKNTQIETLIQNQSYINIDDDSRDLFFKNIPD